MDLFSTQNFMPHGHCYLWLPYILWTNVISDAVIGAAYFTIPGALLYFARKRSDLGLNKVLYLFGAFIVFCGVTHFMAIYTVWRPAYFQFGLLKAATAVVSAATAFVLWPLMPKLIAMPTQSQLNKVNARLLNEVEARKKSENALARRNAELELTNEALEETLSELSITDERLEMAIAGGGLGLWNWNIETQQGWVSDNWLDLLGYSPEDAESIVENWGDYLHPEDRQEVADALEAHLRDDSPFMPEFRMRKKDGQYIWVKSFAKAQRCANDNAVRMAGVLKDIHERKTIEIELARNEAFLSAILESVQEGIVACDENGTLTLFNNAAREFHGLDVKRIGSDQWATTYDLYEADGVTPLSETRIPLWRAFSGEIVDGQEIVIAPQGLKKRSFTTRAAPLYNEQGEKIGAVATMHDVTVERVRAEKLRRQNNELELILNSVPVRIWYKDDKNRILRLNEPAARAMGTTVEEAEGADTYALFPAMAKKYHDDDLEVIEGGAPKLGIVEEFTPAYGEKGWVRTDKVPYTDAKTGNRFVFVASMDITELKNAQEELRRSNAELEQFARVTSHDLQEPLRKLIIFSEFLQNDLGDDLPENARADLDAIISSAARMQQLIKDILSLSRMRTGGLELQAVDPRACIEKAMEIWAPECEDRQAQIVYDAFPEVLADPVLLTQIYDNLIGNALKFVREGETPKIRLTAEQSGAEVILGVRDNGIGIDPDSHDKIFQPLVRLHGRGDFDGTGIGLAICKKGVERLGGTIWVESEPGAGAHFRFSLKKAEFLKSDAA